LRHLRLVVVLSLLVERCYSFLLLPSHDSTGTVAAVPHGWMVPALFFWNELFDLAPRRTLPFALYRSHDYALRATLLQRTAACLFCWFIYRRYLLFCLRVLRTRFACGPAT